MIQSGLAGEMIGQDSVIAAVAMLWSAWLGGPWSPATPMWRGRVVGVAAAGFALAGVFTGLLSFLSTSMQVTSFVFLAGAVGHGLYALRMRTSWVWTCGAVSLLIAGMSLIAAIMSIRSDPASGWRDTMVVVWAIWGGLWLGLITAMARWGRRTVR